MKTVADKSRKQSQSKAVANVVAQQKSHGQRTLEFVDNRVEMVNQRKWGEIISNSTKMTRQGLLNKQVLNNMNSRYGVIQGAWIGRRGLLHTELLEWGVTKKHRKGRGVFHEHIMFEDGNQPRNRGFGPNGVFTEGEEGYTLVSGGYNDAHMRIAASAHINNGKYNLLTNNCQQWVNKVLRTYYEIRDEEPRPKVQEEEGIEMTEYSSNVKLHLLKLPLGESMR